MNKLREAFGIGALVLSSLTGCVDNTESRYTMGTVIKEAGTLAQVGESSGTIVEGNGGKMRLENPTYVLQIKMPEGVYTLSVGESWSKPLEALALAIKEGSKVKIKSRTLDMYMGTEDRVGYLPSKEIIVLNGE